LALLETDTFWLSNTPFEPGSRFPGAGCPRLATFALFRLSAAAEKHPRDIALINTHLDHVSDAQRRIGASMVLHRARYEALVRPGVPIFVTGDLNRCAFALTLMSDSLLQYGCVVYSSASGSDNGAYTVLTGAVPAPAVPDEFARRFPLPSHPNPVDSSERKGQLVMRDLRSVAPRAYVGGKWATFTGFEDRKWESCIDFVFGRSDGGWCVTPRSPSYEGESLQSCGREAKNVFVETALSGDGMLASDHRLVVTDIVIT